MQPLAISSPSTCDLQIRLTLKSPTRSLRNFSIFSHRSVLLEPALIILLTFCMPLFTYSQSTNKVMRCVVFIVLSRSSTTAFSSALGTVCLLPSNVPQTALRSCGSSNRTPSSYCFCAWPSSCAIAQPHLRLRTSVVWSPPDPSLKYQPPSQDSSLSCGPAPWSWSWSSLSGPSSVLS